MNMNLFRVDMIIEIYVRNSVELYRKNRSSKAQQVQQ